MDDNKLQYASAGFERFGHLEERIFQTVEEIKAIRGETEGLRGENSRLNEQVNEKIRENETLRGDIDRLTAQAAEERERLHGENNGLQQQIADMRQNETEMLEALALFEKEREELRNRVEKALTLMESLNTH